MKPRKDPSNPLAVEIREQKVIPPSGVTDVWYNIGLEKAATLLEDRYG